MNNKKINSILDKHQKQIEKIIKTQFRGKLNPTLIAGSKSIGYCYYFPPTDLNYNILNELKLEIEKLDLIYKVIISYTAYLSLNIEASNLAFKLYLLTM